MKLAIFLPQPTPFYISVLFAMKQAFEANGVEVYATTGLLDRGSLIEFCRQFHPDAIFEMNRSRNEIPELPCEIMHIAWIVDLQGRSFNDFQKSEILYFFGTGWRDNYTCTTDGLVDWLAPGFCPQTYQPKQQYNPISDFSFVGHIPLPWSDAELNRTISLDDGAFFTFGELYAQCAAEWARQGGLHQLRPDQHFEIVENQLQKIAGKAICLNDTTLLYDIGTRSTRMLNRQLLFDFALSISSSLRIFGSPNFREWPQFCPYHKGYLSDPTAIRDVYQTSKLNLHEGIGLHFRTLDCMGSGGTLLYKTTSRDNHAEGINSHFEPYVHYIPFASTEDSDRIIQYLRDDKRREIIATQAHQLVHEKHTWLVRTRKILADLQSL